MNIALVGQQMSGPLKLRGAVNANENALCPGKNHFSSKPCGPARVAGASAGRADRLRPSTAGIAGGAP